MLKQILEQVGFQVRETENGQEAVALCKSWNPHLIWMDIRMPVMDGLEATRRIREHELIAQNSQQTDKHTADLSALSHQLSVSAERTPIIALTASVFEEDKDKVLAAGCDDFVRKPFQVDEIFERMAKYLEVRYIYQYIQTAEEKPVTPALTSAEIAALPADLVLQINTAAKGAMSKELLDLLERIPPQYRYVEDTMAEMVRDYRFSEIIALTDNGGEGMKNG